MPNGDRKYQGQGGRGLGGGQGKGPGGDCVCPQCGHKVAHQAGKPCFEMNCPKCGSKMIRGK